MSEADPPANFDFAFRPKTYWNDGDSDEDEIQIAQAWFDSNSMGSGFTCKLMAERQADQIVYHFLTDDEESSGSIQGGPISPTKEPLSFGEFVEAFLGFSLDAAVSPVVSYANSWEFDPSSSVDSFLN